MTHGRTRAAHELRPLGMELDVSPYAEGSCLVSTGETRVLCTASIEDGVPAWREASGDGWVTAEYAMLPRSTHTRRSRERGGPGGRTQEIQRLIGRSLRSVTDLRSLGLHTVTLDCDVLQADGGTRTASIRAACVGLLRAAGRGDERASRALGLLTPAVSAVLEAALAGAEPGLVEPARRALARTPS